MKTKLKPCSYLVEVGHYTTSCPKNVHLQMRYTVCHKLGHSKTTCFSKSKYGRIVEPDSSADISRIDLTKPLAW